MFDETTLAQKNGIDASVKLGDWMLVDCIGFLSLIPVVGGIAAIVIYFILAFSDKTAGPIKTRVQADLVWCAIGLALTILTFLLIFIFAGGVAGFSALIDELQNSLGTVLH